MASATWESNPWVWRISFKHIVDTNSPNVKERPILFRGEMVRAIIEGRKSQTRRVLKPQPDIGVSPCHYSKTGWAQTEPRGGCNCTRPVRPSYEPGDRLWCKENFALHRIHDVTPPSKVLPTLLRSSWYRADGEPTDQRGRWRPSIHMPRWACRLVLEVTDVRVERLQEISEEDAQAEGVILDSEPDDWRDYVTCGSAESARESFRSLWESTYG